MNYRIAALSIALLALTLGGRESLAEDAKKLDSFKPVTGTNAAQAQKRAKREAERKAEASIKRIDINSASAAELKALPGVDEVKAAKIVAGRPYGSKTWLITKKVIDAETYGAISTLIVAKQPYADAAKNAALYKKPN